MSFREILRLIIVAALAGNSAALAGDGGRTVGDAGPSRSHDARQHIFIVRQPFPIQQSPANTVSGAANSSSSKIKSRIDSKVDSKF